MPKKHCPDCKALNAEDAEYCSMCRELLMADVDEASDGTPAIISDAGRWVGPNVPAPGPIREARDTTRRRGLRRPPPPQRARRAIPRVVYILAGMGLGALFSAMLVFIAGLVDQLAFGGEARSLPAYGISIAALSPLASSVATAALLGIVAGGMVALSDSPWIAPVIFAAVFMTYQGWALPGTGQGLAYGSLALLGAGVWGAVYGCIVGFAVRGVLEEIAAQPSG